MVYILRHVSKRRCTTEATAWVTGQPGQYAAFVPEAGLGLAGRARCSHNADRNSRAHLCQSTPHALRHQLYHWPHELSWSGVVGTHRAR